MGKNSQPSSMATESTNERQISNSPLHNDFTFANNVNGPGSVWSKDFSCSNVSKGSNITVLQERQKPQNHVKKQNDHAAGDLSV